MEDTNNKITADQEFEDMGAPMYANNVRFHMSAWDLRMLFGQLSAPDANQGSFGIDWHTDITIPWAQAKLMYLYLGVNIALYEAENGMIKLPPSVIPQPLGMPPEPDPQNPSAAATFEMVQKMVADFRNSQLEGR